MVLVQYRTVPILWRGPVATVASVAGGEGQAPKSTFDAGRSLSRMIQP